MKHSIRDYAEVLYKATEGIPKKEIEGMMDAYADYLKKEGATPALSEIIAAYQTLAANEGRVPAIITTARETGEKELKKIAAVLGEKVEAELKMDQSILGGFIAETDTIRVNGSLANQLAHLHQSLLS